MRLKNNQFYLHQIIKGYVAIDQACRIILDAANNLEGVKPEGKFFIDGITMCAEKVVELQELHKSDFIEIEKNCGGIGG